MMPVKTNTDGSFVWDLVRSSGPRACRICGGTLEQGSRSRLLFHLSRDP